MIKRLFPSVELFSCPDGHSYATCKLKSGVLTFAIRSKQFKQLVQYTYYQTNKVTLRPDELKAALQVAEGEALFGGPTHSVFVRVANWDGK